MSDCRVFYQTQENELIDARMLYNPKKEQLKAVKKKRELSPKEKRIVFQKLRNQGSEKEVFEYRLGGHINMYYVKNKVLFNDLNIDISNISRVLYLATYIDWNSNKENLLVKPGQFNKSYPMTRRDMQILLGLADRTFTNFIKNIKDNNILFEVSGMYYLNPDYFNKGKVKLKEKEYTRLYINTVRDLYAQCEPRQHKQLSYLFKLIPKTHHLNNAIVHNPEEKDISNVKYMNLTDISNFLGLDSNNNNITRLKRDLIKFHTTYDGLKRGVFKYITVEGTNSKYSYFVLNPVIAYSGSDFKVASDILKMCYFKDEK